MIPEVIENGVNGFMTNDEKQMEQYLVDLLNDENLAKKIGDNARKTIVKKYSTEQFVNTWQEILAKAANIVFRG